MVIHRLDFFSMRVKKSSQVFAQSLLRKQAFLICLFLVGYQYFGFGSKQKLTYFGSWILIQRQIKMNLEMEVTEIILAKVS
jgi:hypothetical protein